MEEILAAGPGSGRFQLGLAIEPSAGGRDGQSCPLWVVAAAGSEPADSFILRAPMSPTPPAGGKPLDDDEARRCRIEIDGMGSRLAAVAGAAAEADLLEGQAGRGAVSHEIAGEEVRLSVTALAQDAHRHVPL
ncbi:hypothetical protein AB5S17_15515 [Jiella sp. M17.18]